MRRKTTEKKTGRPLLGRLAAHSWFGHYLYFVLLGVFLAFQLATERFDLQIEEVFWSEELVPNKPQLRYLVNQITKITDDSGKVIGELQIGTRVFSDETPTTSPMRGLIYGWIWHESVLPQGDVLTITKDENVRGRADGTSFGRLLAGTIVREHYLNDTQAWYLFSRSVNVPGSALSSLPADFKEPTWTSFRPSFMVVTTKQGGYRIHSWLTLGQLIFFAPFGLVLLAFLVRGRVVADRQRAETANYLLEFWKTILQIFSGFIIAALIFFFGFKR